MIQFSWVKYMKIKLLEQENVVLKSEVKKLEALVKHYEELFKLSQKRNMAFRVKKVTTTNSP